MGALQRQRHIDPAADAVLLALHHHGAVEPPLEVRRQPVIGGIHARKFRVAACRRDLDAIEE
jgi:hypothetical protein